MSKRNTRDKKSASKGKSRLAAESASVQRDEPDGPLFRGKLDDLQFQAYERAVAYVRHRASEFGDDFKDGPPTGTAFQQGVHEYAPRPSNLQGVHEVAGLFYTLMGLVYVSSDLDDLHWEQPDLAQFSDLLPFDLTCQVRAISCICEGFGVSSEPLAVLAYRWGGICREQQDVRLALQEFAELFPPDELVKVASPSIQRVLRLTEYLWSDQAHRRLRFSGENSEDRNSSEESSEDSNTSEASREERNSSEESSVVSKEQLVGPKQDGRPGRRRYRQSQPEGWGHLSDFGRKMDHVSKSSLGRYWNRLSKDERGHDEESGERVMKLDAMMSVLDQMDRLKK